MAPEHAFLEDACRPSVRLFTDTVTCGAYNSFLGQSYACRALLPCIERTDTERDTAVQRVRHPARLARRALAVLASFGTIHVPPDARHGTLILEAQSCRAVVGPIDAAVLRQDWNRTHPTSAITRAFDCLRHRELGSANDDGGSDHRNSDGGGTADDGNSDDGDGDDSGTTVSTGSRGSHGDAGAGELGTTNDNDDSDDDDNDGNGAIETATAPSTAPATTAVATTRVRAVVVVTVRWQCLSRS